MCHISDTMLSDVMCQEDKYVTASHSLRIEGPSPSQMCRQLQHIFALTELRTRHEFYCTKSSRSMNPEHLCVIEEEEEAEEGEEVEEEDKLIFETSQDTSIECLVDSTTDTEKKNSGAKQCLTLTKMTASIIMVNLI